MMQLLVSSGLQYLAYQSIFSLINAENILDGSHVGGR
jgi:hypothetical protein